MNTYVTVDLGFGDSGKGTMVDYLCRTNPIGWVIRYNGGAQAGHNVAHENLTHTFSQIGSGSFVPGVKTFLSKHVLWSPISLAHESKELYQKTGVWPLELHYIDGRAPVITPFHVFANRIKELVRGNGRHGSCGKGVGELASDLVNNMSDVIRASELSMGVDHLESKLRSIQERKVLEFARIQAPVTEAMRGGVGEIIEENIDSLTSVDEPRKIAEAYSSMAGSFNVMPAAFVQEIFDSEEGVVFEGAQGVLLDEWHGFHPFTTWSTIVPTNAFEIMREAGFNERVETIGITRCFMTRHGAGPLPTETDRANISMEHEMNGTNTWQQNFRLGYADLVLLRYAVDCLRIHDCAPDCLAVTHLDALRRQPLPYSCRYVFRGLNHEVERLEPITHHNVECMQNATGALFGMSPVLESGYLDTGDVVDSFENKLATSVKYLSYGPSFKEKRVVGEKSSVV